MLADCKAEGLQYPYLTQHTGLFFRYYIDRFDFFAQDSFFAVDKTADAVVNVVQTPEYLEFATIMGDYAEKGYINENDLTKTTPETTTQTQDWGISWWTDIPNNEEADNRYVQSVEMVPVTQNWIGSNTTLGSSYAISARCDEKTAGACLEFLTLLNTDSTVANLMAFGIEGEDYNMVDGIVTKTNAGKYNHGAWETASVNVVGLEPSDPANKLELYDEFNLNGVKSIAAGFRFDSSPVDASYASCQQIFQEFGYTLENGGFAPADVPAAIADYQAALDGAGYQDVLAEAQAQYDAWKAVR
jgi:putative aldouronate transport system substrate-binding protein